MMDRSVSGQQSQQCSFRQVDDRNVSTEVELMEWSPKMDLIALANIQGEVALHRLSWQKVWLLSPWSEGSKVNAMAWRPDGKVLAIGYSTGLVLLCDVENSEVLHSIELNAAVTTAKWITELDTEENKNRTLFFQDNSSQFLPKLPSLSKSYGSLSKVTEDSNEDSKKLSDQKKLNVLIIGTVNGRISMHTYGIFPSGDINMTDYGAREPGKVLSVMLSEDLIFMSVIVETNSGELGNETDVRAYSFRTPLLASRHTELQVLSLKYGQILSLMGYLASTIRSISEAWEDILLEIDTKLTSYAEEKFRMSSGTVSDDFLELLMFGTPTDELEKFLLFDLTEKGLKKLGHSIELSYSNIQKLVLKHLQSVGQAIVYHLSEVRGMALWYEKFGLLGLDPESVSKALIAAGSFMMKATEIQQVIDNSMRNFKAFFRWLYVVILRLSDETIPPEINKVTQQDLNFVAEFLKENFANEWDHSKKSSFNLERVGQYLKNEKLQFPPDTSANPWVKLLEDSPSLKSNELLFPHHPEKSLVQQHIELQEAVNKALTHPAAVMGQAVVAQLPILLHRGSTVCLLSRISQICSSEGNLLYTAFILGERPSKELMIIQQSTEPQESESVTSACVVKLQFENIGQTGNGDISATDKNHSCYQHLILDIQFYNEEVLSVLLIEDVVNGFPVLVQLPMKTLQEEMELISLTAAHASHKTLNELVGGALSGGSFVDHLSFRRLENMKAHSLAVSGSRKVACVLFTSRRRVRLLEMDVDDEEEESEPEDDKSFGRSRDESSMKISANRSGLLIDEDENKENI